MLSRVTSLAEAQKSPSPALVLALHCSGASGRQWQTLSGLLSGSAEVVALDLIGTTATGPWCGARPFSLADEAEPIMALVDTFSDRIHLVGHSYGGAVALLVALKRPSRIASLTLYEPTTFSVLSRMGASDAQALQEIRSVAQAVDEGLLSGAYQAAAQRFVDYWNGPGTWAALKLAAQADLVRYIPKACLDFRALFSASIRLPAYRRLGMPILLLRGEHAPRPTTLIVQHLQVTGRQARLVRVTGAGHMGPLTHAAEVARLICEHIQASEALTTERLIA